ncbi:MAG: 5-(carboxyamino)imidazole ribonucleotide mutase [candidate division Zixibacteria bacterium]|nr:5-(carboxyamino)imidazole ribonucleotide mutase [candidate division Zixibacteria bacterium]
MSTAKQVLIILGSKSDSETMKGCLAMLDEFGISYEYQISSAHRHTEKTRTLAETAASKGFKVIIAAAGMAAALPGVIAAHTILPVIGVPMPGSALNGVDALYSIVQMPTGTPVATMAIGSHGAKNSALLAVRILALSDESTAEKLKEYQNKLAKG